MVYLGTTGAVTPERSGGGVTISTATSEERIVGRRGISSVSTCRFLISELRRVRRVSRCLKKVPAEIRHTR